MDCYEILGVDRDASMEELKKAYEKRIKKIEKEVDNKKNADAFFRVLENAYKEALFNLATSSKSEQAIENTVMFTQEELEKIKSDEFGDELCYDEEPYEDEEYDYKYDDYKKEKIKKYKKKHSASKSKSKKSKDDSRKKNDKKSNERDKVEDKYDRDRKSRENGKKESNILLFPFKIIVFPIMIVLSVIIFILRFIDAIIWIATKILIIASIGGASIYGYEVYRGGVVMDVRVFAICGGVFVFSAFLPYITRTVPDLLDVINDAIKDFIFR